MIDLGGACAEDELKGTGLIVIEDELKGTGLNGMKLRRNSRLFVVLGVLARVEK
jgi:hypothetical protein